jgi:hypothetical protein
MLRIRMPLFLSIMIIIFFTYYCCCIIILLVYHFCHQQTKPNMPVGFKPLLFSHLFTFATGIYIGKTIDADELAAYRSASNVATSAWLKKLMYGSGIVIGLTGVLYYLGSSGGRRKSLTKAV